MAKATYYFSHDFSARNDPKLQRVIRVHGMSGVGLYWCLVELLHEQDGYLMLSQCDDYAFALRSDTGMLSSIISDFELFHNDGVKFWSESALNRINERKSKSIKAKESAEARWGNANALQSQSEGNAIKERKGNKRKGNKDTIPADAVSAFDVFWEAYGKKTEKEKCLKAWSRLSDQERQAALTSAPVYVAQTPELKYRKNPLTWLNGKCWTDELPPPTGSVKCPLGNPIDLAKFPNWPTDKPFTQSNITRFNQSWPLRSDNT